MSKRIGIPVFVLVALLVVLSAPQANAGVRFGVFVGGPAYGPVYPGYPYVYSDPYPYPYRTYYYARPYPYYYSAPVYGYSSRYFWRDRRWREHERREHDRRYRR
ncbi:MAG: hypothetical protein M3O35_11395 [Acidobacteriota bacterium]|nr:hypothetical protein [Acidobacteriota bacterium]